MSINFIKKKSNSSSDLDEMWSNIGYTKIPDYIITTLAYSKSIYDNWDNTQTNLQEKFKNNTNLIFCPSLDTQHATTVYRMFSSCTYLVTVGTLDLRSCTNANQMFGSCDTLTEYDLINTSSLMLANSMFSQCRKLVALKLFNTSKVENFGLFAYNCPVLRDVPIFDTSKATNMDNMFGYSNNLSNESLNNIMQMCINATSYNKTKTLKQIGLTSAQASICEGLSNYQNLLTAGWSSGY